ncbi:YdaU family protein [Ramlibacter henchirensis]|uniref:YdaU family protein n=1 Tax=Ramlibacter henchirensis TaxID=204072 RepID=UPI00143151DF|nr:YdaU family protein [Ramlibacter henchirensis]
MNYYEHHIRDYDAATAHLSWDEDMAYTRLLRWYYRRERPIPAEISEACRQVRACTRAQKQAIAAVLEEFFHLQPDGWHQRTCDAVIQAYKDGAPEREAKKKNEHTRLVRHRLERAELFATINAAGHHLPFNAPIAEVRALARSVGSAPSAGSQAGSAPEPETPPETPSETEREMCATGTQTPDPITHLPDSSLDEVKLVPSSPTPSREKDSVQQASISDVWARYAKAFQERHGVPPTRNSKVNGQLKHLLQRIPAPEAPLVAEFYLQLEHYAPKRHPIGLLLHDCEAVRTQWLQARAGQAVAVRPSRSERARRVASSLPGIAAVDTLNLGMTIDVETKNVREQAAFALAKH